MSNSPGLDLESINFPADAGIYTLPPEECAEKIRREIAPSGVNHMICALTDRTLVKAFTGRDLPEAADVNAQLPTRWILGPVQVSGPPTRPAYAPRVRASAPAKIIADISPVGPLGPIRPHIGKLAIRHG